MILSGRIMHYKHLKVINRALMASHKID